MSEDYGLSFSKIYFEEADIEADEHKLYRTDLNAIKPFSVPIVSKGGVINSDLSLLSNNTEMTICLIDKAKDKFKQVKSKRLKKKYWKRTLYYQITREKRW